MAMCISLINMKGGVGKTTLATQLAWYATQTKDKRVLLIDLDPQANASQAVMSPRVYSDHINRDKPTVVNIFEQFTPPGLYRGSPIKMKPQDVIVRRVIYKDGSLLDIVPSRLELSRTLRNPENKASLLPKFISKIEDQYDMIIIDCAPTDSMLTDAAYLCSRFILVPMKAEFLAAIGFPLLSHSLETFKLRHEDHEIDICGLVFNDYKRGGGREYNLARQDVEEKATDYGWYVFENGIPHSDSYYRCARDGLDIDSTKGTHGKVKDEFDGFATEFFQRIGL